MTKQQRDDYWNETQDLYWLDRVEKRPPKINGPVILVLACNFASIAATIWWFLS